MRILMFFVLIGMLPFKMQAGSDPEKMAEMVLNDLYHANGNYIFIKPKIRITTDEKNAALYLRRANIIEISNKTIDVCREMGRDSLAALAYILGHELSHAYQLDLHVDSTSFLAYDRHHGSNAFFEETADVQGVFMAYLAGYASSSIVDDFITLLYKRFDLPTNLNGYPSLAERKSTAIKVSIMSDQLIRIFEFSSYLIALGEYELAIDCLTYVEDWYKGQEIYNNLGVAYFNLALNFSSLNMDPYLYPIELHWETRMKKPLVFRGDEEMKEMELNQFHHYLSKAEEYFEKASKMDVRKVGSRLNLLCVDILRGDYQKVINDNSSLGVLRSTFLYDDNARYAMRIKLVLALAYAFLEEKDRATAYWNEIILRGNELEQEQARNNLAVFKEMKPDKVKPEPKLMKLPETGLIDNVKLHRPKRTGEKIDLNDDKTLFMYDTANSIVYHVFDGSSFFSLQRIKENPEFVEWKNVVSSSDRVIQTELGDIAVVENPKILFVRDHGGNIQEWGKYFRN